MRHWKIAVPLGALALGGHLYIDTLEGPAAGEAVIQAAANPAAVRIDNFHFTPPTVLVTPGTTVTCPNPDDTPHSGVEKGRKLKSAALDTDDTFSQTFTAAGESEYFCGLHPRMVGKIVVHSTN
jgi:plastocyanin